MTEKSFKHQRPKVTFSVTGEVHGSIVFAPNEYEARKAFSKYYKGERILSIKIISYNWLY